MTLGQELRTVGQGLATLDVGDFDLRREHDGYFALAVPRVQTGAEGNPGVRSTWWHLTRRSSTDRLLAEEGPGVLRVLFTPEGMLRLEAAGIARRAARSTGSPDLASLAQILRLIGERLDHHAARMLKVSRRGGWISCEYVRGQDELITDEWKLSDLHGFWQEACRQRQCATPMEPVQTPRTLRKLFPW